MVVAKVDSKIFTALDQMNQEEITSFLRQNSKELSQIKIGLEVFCRYGKDWVASLMKDHQLDLFLDLKLHDIPNTVAKAIHSLEGLPLKFLTIHLSGGRAMIEAAIKAQRSALPDCQLLGVSYLTSLGPADFQELYGISEAAVSGHFTKLFQLAIETGLGGLVCSAHEATLMRSLEAQNKSAKNILVCPGIRFSDEGQHGDQKRVMDPLQAVNAGADYLVMGRSLVQATNLKERLSQLKQMGLIN